MGTFLDKNKQAVIISALAEGSGIRQIERMTGVHRDTIMRLGVRVGHPKTTRVYAWAHETDSQKKRHVTVLHIAPVDSPLAAVKAAIVQEFRASEPAEEN